MAFTGKMTDRLKWVRQRVKDQRSWIEAHGGDLAGYIRRYGDPGIAPCDRNGNAETVSVPDDLAEAFGLRPVPNAAGCYYKEMFGSGGTLIYQADLDCLLRYERELCELEPRYGTWLREAEEREQEMAEARKFTGRAGDMTAADLLSDIEATLAESLHGAKNSPSRSTAIDALHRAMSRLHLGRRLLGLASPSMADDENMLNRHWDK